MKRSPTVAQQPGNIIHGWTCESVSSTTTKCRLGNSITEYIPTITLFHNFYLIEPRGAKGKNGCLLIHFFNYWNWKCSLFIRTFLAMSIESLVMPGLRTLTSTVNRKGHIVSSYGSLVGKSREPILRYQVDAKIKKKKLPVLFFYSTEGTVRCL